MEPEPSEVPVLGNQSMSIEPDDLVESVGDMQHGLLVIPNEDISHKTSVTLEQEEPEPADVIAADNSEHQQLASSEIKVANSSYVVPDPHPSTVVPVLLDSDAGDADKLEAKFQHISIDGAASQGAEIDRDAKMEIERSPVLGLTDSSDGNIETDVGVAQIKEVCTRLSNPCEFLQSEEGLEGGETCRVVHSHSHISASSEVPPESLYAGNAAEGHVNAASLIGATESTTATTLAGQHSEGREGSALASGSVDDQEPITNPGVAANEENAFAGSVHVLGATTDDEMLDHNLDAPVVDQVETELSEALSKADDSVLNADSGATRTLDGSAEGFPYVESETSCDDIAVGDLTSRAPPIDPSMVPEFNAIPQPREENEDVTARNQGEMSEEFDRLKAILQPHADAHTANNPASAGEGELSRDLSVDTRDGPETEDQSGGDERSVHRVITEKSIAEGDIDGAIGRQASYEGPFSVEERNNCLQEHSTQASTTSIPLEVQEGSHSLLLGELQAEKDVEGRKVNTLQECDCGTAGQAAEATTVIESQRTVRRAWDTDAVEDKEIVDSSAIAEASTVSGPKNLAIADMGDDFVDLEIDKQTETNGERVGMALESQVITVLDPSELHKELEAAVTDVNVEADEAEVENGPGSFRVAMKVMNDDKDVEANVDDPSVTENAEGPASPIPLPAEVGEVAEQSPTAALDEENTERTAREEAPATCLDPQEEKLKVDAETEPVERHDEHTFRGEDNVGGDALATVPYAPTKSDEVIAVAVTDPQQGHLSLVNEEAVGVEIPSAATVSSTENYQIVRGTALLAGDVALRDDEDLRKQACTGAARADTQTDQEEEETRTKPLEDNNASSADEAMIEEAPDTPAVPADEKAVPAAETGAELLERTTALHDTELPISEAPGTPAGSGKESSQVVEALETEAHNENPDLLGEGDTSEDASAAPSAAFAESHELVAWVESQPLEENGAFDQRSEETVSSTDQTTRRKAQPHVSEEQEELVERGEIDELPQDGENVAAQSKGATGAILSPPTGKVDAESSREGTSSPKNSYHMSTADNVRIDGDEETSDGDAAAGSVLHTTGANLSNDVDSATVVSLLEKKAEADMPDGDELVGPHEAAGAETESVMDDEVAANKSEQGNNVSEHVDSGADVGMVPSEGDGSGMIRDNVPIIITETGVPDVTIGGGTGVIEQAGGMAIGGVAIQVDSRDVILEDNHQDADTHDTPGAPVEPIPATGEESRRMAESSGGVERDEILPIPYASNSSLRGASDVTCIREDEMNDPRSASKVGRDEVVHSTLAPNPRESFEVETDQSAILAGVPSFVSDEANASVPTSAERVKTEMTLDGTNWERTFAVGAAAKGGPTTVTGDSEMSQPVEAASGAVNSLSERNISNKIESTSALVENVEDSEVRHVGLAMRADSADRFATAVSPTSDISTSNVKRGFTAQETIPTDEAESRVLTQEKPLVVKNDAGESHLAPVSEQVVSKAASAAITEERVSQQPFIESGYQPSVDSDEEEGRTGAISSEGISSFEATQRGHAGKGENESAAPAAGGEPSSLLRGRHAIALTAGSAEERKEEDALPANEDETIAATAVGEHDEIAEPQREILEVGPGHIALEGETPEEDALSNAGQIVKGPQPGEANVLAEAQTVEVYEEQGNPGDVIAEATADEPNLSDADEMISKSDTPAMSLLNAVHEPGVRAEETSTTTHSTARENASPPEPEAETTEETSGVEISENAPVPIVEGSYVMHTSAVEDMEALGEEIENQDESAVPVERLQPRLLHEATNEGLPFDVQIGNAASTENEDVKEDRNTEAKNIKSEGDGSDCNYADAIDSNQSAKSTSFSDANNEIRSGEAMSEAVRVLPQVSAEEVVQGTQEIRFEGTEENSSTRVGAPLFEETRSTIPPQTFESIAVAEDTEVQLSEKEAVSPTDDADTDTAISVLAAPIVEGPEVEKETDPGVNNENAESSYTEGVKDNSNAWPTTRALQTTDVACTTSLELETHQRDAATCDGTSKAEESPDLPALPREEEAKDVVRDAESLRTDILIAQDVPSIQCDVFVEPHEQEVATRMEGAADGGSSSAHVACRSESNEVCTETEAIPLQEGDSLHDENAEGEGTPTALDAGESSRQCTDEGVMSRVEEPHGEHAFSTAEPQAVNTAHVAQNDASERTDKFIASHVPEEVNELASPVAGEALEASFQAAKNGAFDQRSEETISSTDQITRRNAQPHVSEEQAELVKRGEIDELPQDGENVAAQNKEATGAILSPPTGKVDAESSREGTSSLENSYHVSTADDVRIDGNEETSDGDAAAVSALDATDHVVSRGMVQESTHHGAETLSTALVTAKEDASHAMEGADETAEVPVNSVPALYVRDAAPGSGMGRTRGSENEKMNYPTAGEEITIEGRTKAEELEGSKAVGANAEECPLHDTEDATAIDSPRDVSTAVRGDQIEAANVDGQADVKTAVTPHPSEISKTDRPRNAFWRRWMATVTSFFGMIFFQVLKVSLLHLSVPMSEAFERETQHIMGTAAARHTGGLSIFPFVAFLLCDKARRGSLVCSVMLTCAFLHHFFVISWVLVRDGGKMFEQISRNRSEWATLAAYSDAVRLAFAVVGLVGSVYIACERTFGRALERRERQLPFVARMVSWLLAGVYVCYYLDFAFDAVLWGMRDIGDVLYPIYTIILVVGCTAFKLTGRSRGE